MTDPQRLQTILSEFKKRMQKNGATNKARWNAFTSMPTISPVQLARRLNSYGITVTNREVADLFKFVGLKSNSMHFDDFVTIMQISPDSFEAPSTRPKTAKTTKKSVYAAPPSDTQETVSAVPRPRLGRNADDSSQSKQPRPSTSDPKKSKPHVQIDPRFIQPSKKPVAQTSYPEEEDYEDIYGSPEMPPRYSQGDDQFDDEENYGYSKKCADSYEDEEYVQSQHSSQQRSTRSGSKGSPKKSNNSGIDDDLLDQGTYDSADHQIQNEYDDFDDDESYQRMQRAKRAAQYEDEVDDDDSYQRTKKAAQYEDDDDLYQRKRVPGQKGNKNQEPELFSRIHSSNSPNKQPPSGARNNLDPQIFGNRNISSSRSSARSSTIDRDNEEDQIKNVERIEGLPLKKLISIISEHVYSSYPNSKSCWMKWRGLHNALEAQDLRNGLAKDSQILISQEDADKIIQKYGGPISHSTFARLLSDGTQFAEDEKSGPQEMTEDEEAIFRVAQKVRGNKWEDMIYRAPDIASIAMGFADLGIDVDEDDIRILTQKLGKTGFVNAIKANM